MSETTRSLDGLTTITVSPSRKSLVSAAAATRLVTRSVTDPVTRTTTQAYQVGSTWDVSSAGTTTQITTTYRDGQTASVTDEESHTTTYTYGVSADYGGILTTATSGALVSTTHTDPLGRTRKTTSPGSGATTYAYYGFGTSDLSGSRGKLKSVTDADGVATTYGYNGKGEQISTARKVPNPAGAFFSLTTTTTSDVVSPAPAPFAALGTCHRQIQKINSTVVATTYRSIDGLKSATVSLTGDTLTTATRPSTTSGGTSTTTLPDGTITHTTTSLDRTVVTTASYAMGTNLVAATPPTPIASTTSIYDSLGRLLTVTDSRTGENGSTSYSDFTESGTPLKTTTPNGDTINTLDLLGRATETYLPGHTSENPRVTYASYYPSGRVQARWGFQTYPTYNIYNGEGQLTELRTYRNLTTSPVDSDTGGPVTTGDPAITTWNYSPTTGLLTSKLDADSKGPSYTYTLAGRLETRTWARPISVSDPTKVKATYGYTHGLMTSTDYNDNTLDIAITYDSFGRRKSVTNTLASSTFEYAADLGPDKETITYTLPGQSAFTRVLDRRARSYGRDTGWDLTRTDLIGTPPVATTVIENTVTYGYSPSTGQFQTVSNGTDTFTYGYTYIQTNGGPRVGAASGDGLKYDFMPYTLTRNGGILKTIRTYEATRDVLVSIQNIAGTTVRSAYDYSAVNGGVNNLGQRMGVRTTFNLGTGITANAGDTSWGYDDLGQLTSADAPDLPGAAENDPSDPFADRGYAYDTIGNRRATRTAAVGVPLNANGTIKEDVGTVLYAANNLNQYITTPHATAAPVHDADGNLTEDRGGNKNSQDRQYVWDAENRLIAVNKVLTRTTNGAIATTAPLVSYAYDAQSRRIASIVADASSGGTIGTIYYLYDGFNCIAEYTGTALTTRTWGLDLSGTLQGAGGVGGLLAEKQGANTYYPTYDGNGNVSEYLEADGDVAAHYEYDPFGDNVKESYASGFVASSFSYKFSTKPLDPTTGLYYYTYRWYDPLTGRWPSRDPIEEDGGANMYGFVSNNGVNSWDVLGLIMNRPKYKCQCAKMRLCTSRTGGSCETKFGKLFYGETDGIAICSSELAAAASDNPEDCEGPDCCGDDVEVICS
jgi:RHS repeat-associated protein